MVNIKLKHHAAKNSIIQIMKTAHIIITANGNEKWRDENLKKKKKNCPGQNPVSEKFIWTFKKKKKINKPSLCCFTKSNVIIILGNM